MPQYKDIEYSLRRSKRKTASIYIERDGGVSVLVPQGMSDQDVADLIEKKLRWIYRNQAEWRDLNTTRVEREYVNGEGFLYLGRTYRLRLVEGQEQPLLLKNGHFCLRSTNGTPANPDAAFKEFYRAKGKERIVERLRHFSSRTKKKPMGIRVMDLKGRWASCSADGTINFHWKCMMAPVNVLDYIVVHELAHLSHPRHTGAFWNQVDKLKPDWRDQQIWLRQHGAAMVL